LFKIADLCVDRLKEYAKQLVAFLPEDEKRIFHYILHPKEWSDAFAKEKNSILMIITNQKFCSVLKEN
jgi:hypothetical protein